MKKINKSPIATRFGLLLLACAVTPAWAGERLSFPAPGQPDVTIKYRLDTERIRDPALLKQVDAERMAAELMELLALPSHSCREGAMVAGAKSRLESVGAALRIQVRIDDLVARRQALPESEKTELSCDQGKTPPETGNLLAVVPGNPDLPSWNLSFHLDTNQISFEGMHRDGDIIHSAPGTPLGGDDKAGLAIILELLRLVAAAKVEHGPIYIVGMVAEEDSAAGARLIEAGSMAGDIIVSLDGGDPAEIAHAAPTSYRGYITIRTQTSHPAAIHEKKSVSACAVGARFLTQAGFRPEGFPPDHLNVVLHSYFTSCGIDGGRTTPKGEPIADYQYNSISPFWTAAWQLRSLEGSAAAAEMAAGLRTVLDQVCGDAARDRTPVQCEITGTDTPGLTGYVVDENASALQLLSTGYRLAGNPPKVTAHQFGGFNGNYIKERFGLEMLLVGTGGDQAHTNQETISVQGMATVARSMLASILESWRYRRVVTGTELNSVPD
jgi:tripeptide aminopeptidase